MSAVLSDDGRYRYWLEREVPYFEQGFPMTMGVVMINPSTADHTLDDATIRRVRGFASQYGVARVVVANLFAYRTPSVKELKWVASGFTNDDDIVGPDNLFYINKLFEECKGGRVVAAFGGYNKIPDEGWDQLTVLVDLAKKHEADLWCWGHNKDGSPKHPLYLPKDAKMEKWRGRYDF